MLDERTRLCGGEIDFDDSGLYQNVVQTTGVENHVGGDEDGVEW